MCRLQFRENDLRTDIFIHNDIFLTHDVSSYRTGSFSRYGMSGATIAKPDYSEYKLVVAMVGRFEYLRYGACFHTWPLI